MSTPLTLLPDPDPAGREWREDAACLEVDPNDMQPEAATPEEVEVALRVCTGCPVRRECRQLAESQPAAYGVHAGEWFGDPPRSPARTECGWCGEPMRPDPRGMRTYCGDRCQKRARRAALAASA